MTITAPDQQSISVIWLFGSNSSAMTDFKVEYVPGSQFGSVSLQVRQIGLKDGEQKINIRTLDVNNLDELIRALVYYRNHLAKPFQPDLGIWDWRKPQVAPYCPFKLSIRPLPMKGQCLFTVIKGELDPTKHNQEYVSQQLPTEFAEYILKLHEAHIQAD